MKKYTSDEVIALVQEYKNYQVGMSLNKKTIMLFPNWLKEKEQSELPVKDQLIWVKDTNDIIWNERCFAKFIGNTLFCYVEGYNSSSIIKEDELSLIPWDEYSITDPNGIQ
jgi:hypothetical protein